MAALRPYQRRIVGLVEQGVPIPEIAWRFRRSPGHIQRVLGHAEIRAAADDTTRSPPPPSGTLRPLEQRIIDLRERGVSYSELAARFRRSPGHVERIEALARYKLAHS